MGFNYEDMKHEDRSMDYEELLLEYRCLKTVLHAAVLSSGGVLVVNDEAFARADRNSKIIRHNDAKNNRVVFKAQSKEGGE